MIPHELESEEYWDWFEESVKSHCDLLTIARPHSRPMFQILEDNS